jgi:pheromone a factor receptor
MHDSALPVVTTIAIILLLLAGSAQWRARNLGTLLNIGWTLAGNLSFLLNTLIWRDHSRDAAPVFCDICRCSCH